MTSFNVTKEAVYQIKIALKKRKNPNAALRIGVRGGGCSGLMYHMEFCDKPPTEKDNILIFQNVDDEFVEVRIYIDNKSIVYLNGSELIWTKELTHWGFKINNPQVKSECGCKESFTV